MVLVSCHLVAGQGKHSLASPSFDCTMRRELLYARATEILPPARASERRAVWDRCNATWLADEVEPAGADWRHGSAPIGATAQR